MKSTLLQIVQSILSDMDSEDVNSSTDTVEAQQVASVVEDTYFNIIAARDIPEHNKLIPLISLDEISTGDNILMVEDTKYTLLRSVATHGPLKTEGHNEEIDARFVGTEEGKIDQINCYIYEGLAMDNASGSIKLSYDNRGIDATFYKVYGETKYPTPVAIKSGGE